MAQIHISPNLKLLRKGRLRKRFDISPRQWKKMEKAARKTRTASPRVFFSQLWRDLREVE